MARGKTTQAEARKLQVTTTQRPNGSHGYRVSDPIQGWSVGGFDGIGQYRAKASAQRAGKVRASKIEGRK